MTSEETTEKSRKKLDELLDAIEVLSDNIYSVDELERAYIAIDLVASKISYYLGIAFEGTSTKFLSSLDSNGLDPKVESYCYKLGNIAKEKLYDDDAKTEDRLEDADSTRDLLYNALWTFWLQLEEQLVEREEAE